AATIAGAEPDLLVLRIGLHVLDPGDLPIRVLRARRDEGAPVGEALVPILHIHLDRHTELLLVRKTARLPGLLPRLCEHREEDGSQDSDNGYHNKQLDEGKPWVPPIHTLSLRS